ncbi:MAG: cytochrome c biogenesis protein [Solirubrobacteraceae bacterium]
MVSTSGPRAGSPDIDPRPRGPEQRPKRTRVGGLARLSIATTVAMTAALGLVFFYAPLEAEQGFLQKIFYVHVPLAIVSLCGFVLGGLLAIQYLRTREARWDARSYVVIHMSLIFGLATLITGSIWAKGSWGHWWVWNEPTLVSFLIVFLLYATYQPLRFAIEDPERQSRYAAVFAITAGAFVPMNFIAVRLSSSYLHPRVLGSTSNLPGPMALTFLVSLGAMVLLFATLCSYELAAKRARSQVRALRRRLAGEQERFRAPGRSAAPSAHSASPVGASSVPRTVA